MILLRQPCPTCGTKFTPESAEQIECGECATWIREFDAWGAPDLHEEGPARARRTPDDVERSLDNYRAVTGRRRRPVDT